MATSNDWDLKNKAKISPKTATFGIFDFLILLTVSENFYRAFLYHIEAQLLCAISSKSYDWDSSESDVKN